MHGNGPLSGMRIIEGSAFVAAPSGGMHLAQLGAEVIRFDQIGGGIDYQRWPVTSDGVSLYWTALNKGKRSIALDLRSVEGRELVQALIAAPGSDAGMFLSNFPNRGWMSYETLVERRPDLIMTSILGNPDGSTAVDYTVNAAVGFPAITGTDPTGRPTNHVLPAWDLLCGQQAVIGLLAAERYRRATGAGQLVSISLADVAFAATANLGYVAEVQVNGTQRERLGNELYGAFGRDFETSDGRRFIVVAISIKQWTGMIAAIGAQGLVESLAAETGADFALEGERFAHRHALASIVADWAGQQTLAGVADAFDAHGVCWGPYQDFIQMVEDDPRCSPTNPMFQMIDQPGVGSVLAAGSPLSFSELARDSVAPAPTLGADSEPILADVLDLSPAEIGRLFDAGTVA